MSETIVLLIDGPTLAPVTIVLAHGAGAGMDTPIMTFFAEGLAAAGFRVVRFEFPYMAQRRQTGKQRPPDREPILRATWLAVIEQLGAKNLVIGGKSMGGRIATQLVAAEKRAPSVKGLVVLGYPLNPPARRSARKRPNIGPSRAEHLYELAVPLLVVQGARDAFGGEAELSPVVRRLRRGSRLVVVPDGDHSLGVRKSSGLDQEAVYDDVADAIVTFCRSLQR